MGRIPTNEYIESQGCIVVTSQLIELYHTHAEIESFDAWFSGQTGIVMPDNTLGVYVHDYERWLDEGRLNHQLPYSWD